jgi:hypothetical protein
MNRLLRATVCVLVLGLIIALTGFFVVPWLDGGAQRQRLRQEQVRSDALKKRYEAVLRCVEGKAEVTAEVVAGRLSLVEAIDRFRRLQALQDDGQDELLGTPSHLAVNDDEIAQNILRWVFSALCEEPSRRAAVMTRLEKELAEWQARRQR